MFDEDGAYLKNCERLAEIAKEKSHIFNPDKKRINKVIGLMTKNLKEFGKYYCPCKQHHPLDPNVNPLCPCDTIDEEVAQDGHCFCKLFFKGGNQ